MNSDLPSGKQTELWKMIMFSGKIQYFYGDFHRNVNLPEGISWFINPATIVVSTIIHSYWRYKPAKLFRGPHIVSFKRWVDQPRKTHKRSGPTKIYRYDYQCFDLKSFKPGLPVVIVTYFSNPLPRLIGSHVFKHAPSRVLILYPQTSHH